MMLANHTSIRNVFKVIVEQYKQFRKRDAFMQQYKQTKIFADNLQEFDESEEVVRNLIDEYAAAEKENYIEWGADEERKDGGGGMEY